MIKRLFIAGSCLVFTSGCLMTRAQMKETQSGDSNSGAVVGHNEPTPVNSSSYATEELKSEVTRLNGRIEELERSQANTSKNYKESDEYKAMAKRIDDLEKAQLEALEQLKKVQAQQPPPERKDLFELAKKELTAKNYKAAVDNFNRYLENPKAQFAEQALYLRGEAQFQLKSFKSAILDFANFPEKFTKSDLYPKALLRIAQSYEALGMKEESKAFYVDIVDKFPKSAEAKTAKKKIK